MTVPLPDFVHDTTHQDLPPTVRHQMRRCLLDLMAVAAAGTATPMSRIVRNHAYAQGPGGHDSPRLLFDGRRVTPPYAALANAATIDSMDGHDGHRMVKGHAGAAVLPAALAFLDGYPDATTHDLVATMAIGYEVALRAGLTLHANAADYHSSGAWNALGAAAIGSRTLGLHAVATEHALGIAEYAAPRAPMMRAIAHPTMVKDSSAWGAQTGVSAALLAADGFTGSPADLTNGDPWADLGTSWHCLDQYFKPYPVCRWAHPAITAALEITARPGVTPNQIAEVEVISFEEATRLDTYQTVTTEQAQYSLPFTVATALAHGRLDPSDVLDPATDRHAHRLMDRITLTQSPEMSAEFPGIRRAALRVRLTDGRTLSTPPMTAKGDPEDPLSEDELQHKFRSYTRGHQAGAGTDIAARLLDDAAHPLAQILPALTAAAAESRPSDALHYG